MHPLGTRELEPSGRLAGNGLLTNTIGNPLETTIALSHLIFEGTLDRFPGLKICAAHGAGFLPSYANRSDAVLRVFPDRVGTPPKKKPTEYLRNGQILADTIMFTGEAVRHLIHEMGVENVVMGTDYPFPWNTAPVDHILSIPDITDADKIAILGGTAAKTARDRGLAPPVTEDAASEYRRRERAEQCARRKMPGARRRAPGDARRDARSRRDTMGAREVRGCSRA
jgi:aminocarboxymuconate-semialdehyde decarboxylase